MQNQFLLVLLILSGFTGLAYQLLWTRLMALAFGSTTLSFSTVLAVFFGGLALGSYFASRFIDRIRRPLFAYGMIEVSLTLSCMLLYPALKHLDQFFALLDHAGGQSLTYALLRFAVAAPLLLVPTVLMGLTLPFACKFMIKEYNSIGKGTALIYGCNTFGAFLGVYLVTYHLLPAFGIFMTTVITAALNLAIGLVALTWDFRNKKTEAVSTVPGSDPVSVEITEEAPAEWRSLRRLLALCMTFSAGFAFVALEVVWTRFFSTALSGTIYGVGSVLIAVLAGIAVGSLISQAIFDRRLPLATSFVAAQLLLLASAVAVFLQLPAIVYGLLTIGEAATGMGGIHGQLLVVFASLFVPSLAAGCAFPMVSLMIQEKNASAGKSLGIVYAINTMGCILGSLVTGFWILPVYGSSTAIACALGMVGLSILLALPLVFKHEKPLPGVLMTFCAIALAVVFQGFDARVLAEMNTTHGLSYEKLLQSTEEKHLFSKYFKEGENATVQLTSRDDNFTLSLNGLVQGSRTKLPPHFNLESFLVSFLPLAHVDSPRNALLVGLGAGPSLELLTRFGVPRIKVIEIEKEVAVAVNKIYGVNSPIFSPSVDLEFNDARNFLNINRVRHQEKFDVIASMPSHPWVASSIFTKEFFTLARQNLSDQGVFMTWFLGAMKQPIHESLIAAFAEVFPNYVVYSFPDEGAVYLVGSPSPISLSRDRLNQVAKFPELSARNDFWDPMDLLVYAVGSGDASVKFTRSNANTDDNAYVEAKGPLARASNNLVNWSFLPQPYLAPAFFDHDWQKNLPQYLERLLGSPDGYSPTTKFPSNLLAATRLFSAHRSLLSDREQNYFKARLWLAQGEVEAARDTLTTLVRSSDVAAGDHGAVDRCHEWLALSYPEFSPERRAILLQIKSPTPSVIYQIAEFDVTLAVARARAIASGAAATHSLDPLTALAAKNDVRGQDLQTFKNLMPGLYRVRSRGYLRIAHDFAQRQNLDIEAALIARLLSSIEDQLVRKYLSSAKELRIVGGRKKVENELNAVLTIDPSNETAIRSLYQMYSARLDPRAADFRNRLHKIGKTQEWVDLLDFDISKNLEIKPKKTEL